MKQKETVSGGAILWARKTTESEIFLFKPDVWFKIWFYLVNKVNWKDEKFFQRGECFLKYDWIMDVTGATHSQVKHCIEYLKKATMIATRKTTRGMVLKVLNYEYYQTLDNYYYDIESHTERNLKGTQKENRSHTILKKEKKEKNVKNKDIILHSEQGSQINEILKEFEKLNPSYERLFANKTQRSATERLLKKMGVEKLKATIAAAGNCLGKNFAPVITTPLELEEKLGKLIIFYQGKKPNNLRKA